MPVLDTYRQSRGAVHFVNIGDAPIGHDAQRVGQSFLSPGPWWLVHFQAADVRFVTGLACVRVGEWVLCLLPDGWYASRPQPCPGRFFRVVSLRDIPAASPLRIISDGLLHPVSSCQLARAEEGRNADKLVDIVGFSTQRWKRSKQVQDLLQQAHAVYRDATSSTKTTSATQLRSQPQKASRTPAKRSQSPTSSTEGGTHAKTGGQETPPSTA